MQKIKILALFGESSAGKDSIQHWLVKNLKNTHGIISYTSRPRRDYEIDGKDYYFISKKQFETLICTKQILEFTEFNNWYYGTAIDSLEKDKINIGVFNPSGIRNLLQYYNKIEILPVWIQADEKTRLIRSLNREANPNCKEICRRFLADCEDFSNINFDYEIYQNDNNNDDYYGFLKRPKIFSFMQDKTD